MWSKIKKVDNVDNSKSAGDIYIYIYIMRGKKDVTTFPDKPISRIALNPWRVKRFTKQACREM